MVWHFISPLASPRSFYKLSGQLRPWISGLGAMLFGYGLIGGLLLAPADYQQGDGFRIIYLHVPSAFLSLFVYVFMACAALVNLVWRIKLTDAIIDASAPLGAWFTFLALITGSLWGKPMWGTWWIWDARLTSELILLFLYLALIALKAAIHEPSSASRAGNILLLVGIVNIPIIHYSVYWWNTLHQGATLSKFAKPEMAPSMLYPLLGMILAFMCYYFAVMLTRARTAVLWRERNSQWVRELPI